MPTRSGSKSTGWIGAPDVDKAKRKTTAAAAKKTQQQEEEEELEELEQKIKTLESHMKEKGAKFRSVLYSEPYDDEDPRGDPHATHGELVFDLEERFLKLEGLNKQWLIQQQTLQRPIDEATSSQNSISTLSRREHNNRTRHTRSPKTSA